MERLFLKKLIEWKENKTRKPLIVRGARQVGKSHIISFFGKKYFNGNIHTINLEKNPDWHVIFEQNFDTERILFELSIVLKKKIDIETDLLFIDEIQYCPKAIIALRYFYEECPDLHIIAAGSLLEFALKDISFPVGRIEIADMYPMNFYEFLLALNENQLAKIISENHQDIAEIIDKRLKEFLKLYFFVGGMPEIVQKYIDTKDLLLVNGSQGQLLETYQQDFSKYAGKVNKDCLLTVLKGVSLRVGNQIKYAQITQDFTGPTIRKAFDLLVLARLFTKIKATSNLTPPLVLNSSESKFKVVFLDIGLLVKMSGLDISEAYLNTDISTLFNGILAEQFVGQELLSSINSTLFYWSRNEKNSNAEVDYVFQYKEKILPIEVKSGSSGRLKSLHFLHQKYPDISQSYIFSNAKYGKDQNYPLSFLPLYYASNFYKSIN